MMEGKSQAINVTLDREYSRKVEENRKKLASIAKAVIFCGHQNISLRGYRDDSKHTVENAKNTGNFQALLYFGIDAGDKVLEEHFWQELHVPL